MKQDPTAYILTLRCRLEAAEENLTRLLNDPTAPADEILDAEHALEEAEYYYLEAVDPPFDFSY